MRSCTRTERTTMTTPDRAAAIRPEPTRIPMGGVDKCLVCGWQGRPDEEHLHTIPGVPDRHTPASQPARLGHMGQRSAGACGSGVLTAANDPEEQAVLCSTCGREMTTAEAIGGDCCEACLVPRT